MAMASSLGVDPAALVVDLAAFEEGLAALEEHPVDSTVREVALATILSSCDC